MSRTQTIDVSRLKALIFDVDGTLYRQAPVRRSMFWRLLRAHMRQPVRLVSTLQVLCAYRTAQEVLRRSPLGDGNLAKRQLQLACDQTRTGLEVVHACVARWMEREPLELVARSLRSGVVECLCAAAQRGLRLGAFSDYPAVAKLTAMGVKHFFDVVLSAHDPEVQEFKPSPRGLEVTLQQLGIKKHQALYIGDRPEVDAAAASAAGIACVIIGQRNGVDRRGWVRISDYRKLKDAIARREHG
jgi:FMN phosphatase YigB (HAD superfamily)